MSEARKIFLSGMLVGSGFGLALEKTKVFMPFAIQSQMSFHSFIMLKVFLSATATGLIVISSLEKLGKCSRASKASGLGFQILGGYGGNLVGGLILGAGITLSAACPGTIFAQLAGGSPSAPYVISGAVTAALTFGYFHGLVSKKISNFMKSQPAPTLDKLVNKPAMSIALIGAAGFASIVFALERLFPWQQEITSVVSNFNPSGDHMSLTSAAWSPVMGGILIGLMQIPSYLLTGVPLGASSSYMTFGSRLSGLVDPKSKERAPYYQGFMGPDSLYQIGIMTGVFLASLASISLGKPQLIHSNISISPLQGFIGGLMLIYGARMAGGCTSGHGISGMARLSMASLISTAAMFAGAMGTMALMRSA